MTKFKANTRRRALEYEKDLVKYWKDNKTFEKSVGLHTTDNAYVFYDGPPFITGVPHHGTLLSSLVKDVIPRYQTMKGKRVERIWGWDCHGLPAENFVEKKLGIVDRNDIGDKICLADYITTARESMVATGDLWEDTVNRIGRWVNFKGAYKTMDKNYMESVWWAFKTLYEKGKIYEGERVLMYDTCLATPLSKAEVTMDTGAYQDVTDPSVFVKFKIIDEDTNLLAWTTTPWTLAGNTALAINSDFCYVEVELEDKTKFILAKDSIEKVLTDEKHNAIKYTILRTFKGKDLVGKSYIPLFKNSTKLSKNAHKVWAADYVTIDSGTGIVHIAPAYGEEDFELAKINDIPLIHILDDNGNYTDTEWIGQNIWDINKIIAKTLYERGIVWKIEYIRHEYPHNPRTGNRLIYRAHPSWFFDIDSQRSEMLEQNSDHINWFPEHIKHGRFEKNIEQAPDWNLSRDRFWATAMPVWKGIDKQGKEHIKVIGSYSELKELSGIELEDYHRPWVDEITFKIDGVKYSRIDKVLDCWFESGSMPFAQFHYPFENVEKFEKNFPGDFIVEYVGQVRAWFYYVHAVSVGLFGCNAFKNVIVTGNIAGNDGMKMSKSRGNFTDPNELMDKYSADSWRFLLLSSPLLNAEDYSLVDKDVADMARKLGMIWNMYDFFTMYAEVDNWTFDCENNKNCLPVDPSDSLTNALDKWIISRLHQLIEIVSKNMDNYNIPDAVRPILPFIEDASNWYVRRSRRRFWKAGDDTDKNNAYQTLHYVLVKLAQLLAPFTPFLAEELYQKLTDGESVHLLEWPKVGKINQEIVCEMETVRLIVNECLAKRAIDGVKIRQPLGKLDVYLDGVASKTIISNDSIEIIKDEINVKQVIIHYRENTNVKSATLIKLDMNITQELKKEGIAREIIRNIQTARKDAGLNIEDRIELALITDNTELKQAINKHNILISDETLAIKMSDSAEKEYSSSVKIDDADLLISLQKA